MKRTPPRSPIQLSLPFEPARPGLRVIEGGGQPKPRERLNSPEAVMRLLVEASADVLLRRISPERAHEIERQVGKTLRLFESSKGSVRHRQELDRALDALESLMDETRSRKKAR